MKQKNIVNEMRSVKKKIIIVSGGLFGIVRLCAEVTSVQHTKGMITGIKINLNCLGFARKGTS